MLAPPITKENAVEMARRSNAAQKRTREARAALAQQVLAQPSDDASDKARRDRVKAQIDFIDGMIEDALKKGNWLALDAVTKVKARLWPLAEPTAGAMRPAKQSRRAPPPVVVSNGDQSA